MPRIHAAVALLTTVAILAPAPGASATSSNLSPEPRVPLPGPGSPQPPPVQRPVAHGSSPLPRTGFDPGYEALAGALLLASRLTLRTARGAPLRDG
jgi:hypothetical protein